MIWRKMSPALMNNTIPHLQKNITLLMIIPDTQHTIFKVGYSTYVSYLFLTFEHIITITDRTTY